MLEHNGKKILATIVSSALQAAVHGDSFTPVDPDDPALCERCGCFVTYKTREQLRGCIGCFTSDKPLWQCVAEYAVLSATEDPRFAGNRITAAEIPDVIADVSVLSPLQKCEDPLAIRLGVDGIYIRSGMRSGCFLPQVATETGWSVEEFWGYCCSHKAGLPSDSWRQPGLDLFTFTADVFQFSCATAEPEII